MYPFDLKNMNSTTEQSGFSISQLFELLLAFFFGVLTLAAFKGCPF